MMQLPRKVGHFTLMRRLGADGVAESYVAILDEPAGKQVVARRIHTAIVEDEVLMARIRARVGDLVPVRHPSIATVHGIVEFDGDAYVIEDWVDGVGLDVLADRARARRVEAGGTLPHNVFLDLAAQVCNGLEALHGRPGQESGAEHVLHLGLSPQSVVVRESGQLALCGLGLVATPTILPQSATGIVHNSMEYLAPEQTHPEQSLSPATDVFALGSVLYELLTLKPMFRAASNLQTIQRVRKAEVTTELLEVKDLLPGLDRVLYRALSVNPRHRYQRAFVLREDLRGLMAGYSFADIKEDARGALAPYLSSDGWDELPKAAANANDGEVESTAALLGDSIVGGFDHDAPTGPPLGSAPDIDHDAETLPAPDTSRPAPVVHPDVHVDHDADTFVKEGPPARLNGVDLEAKTLVQKGRPSPVSDVDLDAETLVKKGPPAPVHGVDLDADTFVKEGPPDPTEEASLVQKRPVPPADGDSLVQKRPVHSADGDSLVEKRAVHSPDGDSLVEKRPVHAPDEETLVRKKPSFDEVPLPPTPLSNDSDTASFLRAVQGLGATPDPTDAPARAAEPTSEQPEDTMAYLRAAGAGPMPEPKLDHTAPEPGPPEDAPVAGMAPRQEVLDAPPIGVLDTQERPSPFGDSAPPSATKTIEQPAPAVVADAEPDPTADAEAAAAARERLAPADSLHAPESEPGAKPRQEAPTVPMPRPQQDDDDLAAASSGVPMWAMAAGAGIAAVALLACLGMGGTFLGASQMASTDAVIQAPAEAPAPKAAAVEPVPSVPDPKPATERPQPKPSQAEPQQAAAAAPSPRPQPAANTPRPSPTPRPAVRPRPAVATAPPPPEPAASTYDAVAAADDVTQQEQGTADEEPLGPVDRDTLDRLAGPAFGGSLSSTDRSALSAVPAEEPMFTRARTLLYLDAKARSDVTDRDQHLAALMGLPENQYNPALLVEEAWVAMGRRDWSTALDKSARAERHWARLPSDLIFSRKAMIYEIQAKAHLGSFYASEGDDASELDRAIKGWQRYKRHAETQARSDLMATADQQLSRLYDIQRRLE